MFDTTKYLSVNEASKLIGCTVGRVRQMLIAGELIGMKINQRAWIVDRRSAERKAKDLTPYGRPRNHDPKPDLQFKR